MANIRTVDAKRLNSIRLAGGLPSGDEPPPRNLKREALHQIANGLREQSKVSLQYANAFDLVAFQGTEEQVALVLRTYEETERMELGLPEKEPDVSQTN